VGDTLASTDTIVVIRNILNDADLTTEGKSLVLTAYIDYITGKIFNMSVLEVEKKYGKVKNFFSTRMGTVK